MSAFDWRALLKQLSQDVLARLDDAELAALPPEAISSQWLGFPGITSVELAALEKRLGHSLPPSYREFLGVSNGWRWVNDFVQQLWASPEVDWLNQKHPQVVEAWTPSDTEESRTSLTDEDYYVYGDKQDPALMRIEYLTNVLEIGSGQGDDFILLNPKIVSEGGEWEAWYLASWIPGAERFRSFSDLMVELHKKYVEEVPALR